MSSTYSIATSKTHWASPFTLEYQGKKETLSTKEKVIAVVAALLTVVFAPITFYAVTAYFKNRKIQEIERNRPDEKTIKILTVKSVPKKVSQVANPALNIYTTGLADVSVRDRWNQFYLPYIEKNFSNCAFTHFDPGTIPPGSVKGQINAKEFHIDKEHVNSPSVIFDFAHCVNDYVKHSNALYIPYEGKVKTEKFLNFGLKPFTIEKGSVVTYLTKLQNKDYAILDSYLPLPNKTGGTSPVPFYTIRLDNVEFDTPEKVKYLYLLIRVFNLKELAKELRLNDFYTRVVNHTNPGQIEDFKDSLTAIKGLAK